MHAPVIVQHYRLANDHENIPMLDIKEFVRNCFSAHQLEQHIFNDEGGDSRHFLESILQPDSIVISSSPDSHVRYFTLYGVGLASQFKVHDDFYNPNIHRHNGHPSGDYKGLHAMALVGHRTDAAGKVFYLLQNWWKHKQFVEVDEEYLENSGATIYFIKTPQTEIPTNFPKQFGKFFELELVDKPEGLCHEMTRKYV